MARNRKNQSAAIRFGPAIKAFLLCAFFAGSGLGYVWQKSQIGELGRQIASGEKDLRLLLAQNKKLQEQLGMMHSPIYLQNRVKELNLGLVPSQPSQKWVLRETPASAPEPRERQYARQ